jgi:hypothetical protein
VSAHDFPINKESSRHFRLWHAQEKKPLRWRCYVHHRNAHVGALIEARFAKPGETIEVFDCRTGRLLGQYTRKLHDIKFFGPEFKGDHSGR